MNEAPVESDWGDWLVALEASRPQPPRVSSVCRLLPPVKDERSAGILAGVLGAALSSKISSAGITLTVELENQLVDRFRTGLRKEQTRRANPWCFLFPVGPGAVPR